MKKSDLPHMGAMLRQAGEDLDRLGLAAWNRSREWAAGPRAARLDDSGGSRLWCWDHERDLTRCRALDLDCDGEPYEGGDPTGEAATSYDRTDTLHVRLRKAIAAAYTASERLRSVLGESTPTGAVERVTAEALPADVAAAGWCRSCFRDGQYLQPIEVRASGHRRHRDLCRWCAGFQADYGKEPPLELVEQRHRGMRVTVTDIEKALSRKRAG